MHNSGLGATKSYLRLLNDVIGTGRPSRSDHIRRAPAFFVREKVTFNGFKYISLMKNVQQTLAYTTGPDA